MKPVLFFLLLTSFASCKTAHSESSAKMDHGSLINAEGDDWLQQTGAAQECPAPPIPSRKCVSLVGTKNGTARGDMYMSYVLYAFVDHHYSFKPFEGVQKSNGTFAIRDSHSILKVSKFTGDNYRLTFMTEKPDPLCPASHFCIGATGEKTSVAGILNRFFENGIANPTQGLFNRYVDPTRAASNLKNPVRDHILAIRNEDFTLGSTDIETIRDTNTNRETSTERNFKLTSGRDPAAPNGSQEYGLGIEIGSRDVTFNP